MTDTGKKKYSSNESLNRILRGFIGNVAPNDAPGTVPGSILSEDEMWSKFAEIVENKDPEETGQVPAGWTVPVGGIASATETTEGIVEIATDAEVATGTDTDRAVTPAGLASVIGTGVEYGEIYNNSTGTATVALSTSWQKVTGSFQGNTISSTNITPDFANDLITINKVGVYFVSLTLSFSGSTGATINVAAYVDSVRTESIRFRRKLGTGGDVGSAATLGIINVTGTPVNLEVYAMADTGTPNFKLEAGQIFVHGVG